MTFAKLRLKLSKVIILFVFLILCFSQNHQTDNLKTTLLYFFGILLIGVGVLGRVWCSLYISGYKNDKLVTQGPYSLCRNPLYFFSLIGVIGVGMTTETYTIPLLIIVLFSFYYPFVIKNEQKFLLGIYKDEFLVYMKNVPCFFPSFSNFTEPEEYTVKPKRFRNFLTEVIWFFWLAGIIELIEHLKELNYIPIYFHLI
jgi:protein-S-isoprenylcysteine O-methyltransferase Ste14